MIRLTTILMAGAAMTAVSSPVLAQTAPAQPAQQTPPARSQPAQDQNEGEAPADAVTDVVVTGNREETRTSIDSVSYSLDTDLQATTGSLADALRNVPSVDVDPEGNVSLRGDANVTILVDGRPSGILSGAGRGQAIQQLPAGQYSRIEVMTNPSAAYSPEGSGGVINLITRPNAPRPGRQTTGSIRVNVGDDGRWNAGVSGSIQEDRLTLSGDVSYRADPVSVSLERIRDQFNPATGALLSTTTTVQEVENDQSGVVSRVTAEYRLTDRTQLTGELRGVAFEGEQDQPGLFETRNAAGTITSRYRRDGSVNFDFVNWGATVRLLHRFDDAGHEWSNELRFDENSNEVGALTLNRFLAPVAPDFYERLDQLSDQTTIGLTSAYTRPFAEGGQLRLGYELNIQKPEQDFRFLRGGTTSTLVPAPGFSNRFEADQTVHAWYATWERPLTAQFSAQLGLRLEQADIEIADLTGGTSAEQDYFKAYPTAHLQYTLSETQTLRASYSRRIARPSPAQLNPFVAFQDPLNLRSGNPDLEPQETDAFEVMWQMREGQSFYMATAYLRDTDGAFTEVARDIGGGVLLTRPENLGSRRDLGLELTATGPLTTTLRYSGAVNLFRQEIDSTGIPGGGNRDGTFASGRMNLTWQPTPKDFVQVSGFWQGEQLLAQGTREAGGMVNIGYRRKLTEQLSFVFTGRDVLGSFNNDSVFETPAFREEFNQDINLTAFYIGLSWSLGNGQRRQPEQFDFSTGPTGG